MKRIDIEEYEVAVKHAKRVLHGKERKLEDGSVATPIKVFRDGFRPAEFLVVIPPEPVEEIKLEQPVVPPQEPEKLVLVTPESVGTSQIELAERMREVLKDEKVRDLEGKKVYEEVTA